MKIIYLASMYDEETYSRIFVKDNKPIQAAGKYHTLMCEGLVQNGVDLKTISILPINKANFDGKRIPAFSYKQNNVLYNYVKTVNHSLFKKAKHFISCKQIIHNEDNVNFVLVDYLNLFASMGAIKEAKKKNIKVIAIVTDLPEYLGSNFITKKIMYKTLEECDGYIFLTKQMNEKVNTSQKPYIVLEGHSDINMEHYTHSPVVNNRKTILYAGSLFKKYGILNLCYAFDKVYKSDEELHIYGGGDAEEEIKTLTKRNSNIKYYGVVQNKMVVEDELDSVLLVNPRQAKEEFTKYSFPSKTMEYMATGTPVLMYPLPGMPNEYLNYVFLIQDSGCPVDDIGNAIRNILDSGKDLLSFGIKAKNYVLKEKNNVVQANKLIKFLEMI